MVWPIMGDACRRSIHLKDGVEASQRVRRSGRSAPSSTLAFNEQSGNCSGPEVGFEEIRLDLPQARLNEALGADAFACPVSAVVCEQIRLGHKENTYDPPSQNDARRTRAS